MTKPPGDRPGEVETRTVGAPAPTAEKVTLAAGTGVGRFILGAPLGKGGMGVVYAAHDPELNRDVALKLLRPDRADTGDASSRGRLLREAQAMARLSHPNVLTVHEVGTHQDSVFLAMERVDGSTLKAWLRERPRSWREIVAVFLQAGQGLAAAHAAGFIHRDFKPDNVLVRKDGRALVADFGLARVVGAAGISEPSSPSHSSDALSSSLTLAGAVVGTLAYMSPEQLRSEPLDARADEFSFCVALFEALLGERPYERSEAELQRKPMPSHRGVPGWVLRPILKGLALDPAERYPSMAALLAALQANPAPRRRRIGYAAGVLALVGVSVFAATRVLHKPSLCNSPAQQLAGTWDDAVRQRLAAAFQRAGGADAAGRWSYAEKALDHAASRWVKGVQNVCSARNTQSDSSIQLRLECLAREREDFRVVTGMFADPPAALIESAVPVVQTLKNPSECDDARALPVIAQLEPAKVPVANALRARHVQALAKGRMGQLKQAIAEHRAILEEVRALGDPVLEVEVLLTIGRELSRTSSYKDSIPVYRETLRAAERQHMDGLAITASSKLVADLAMSGAPHPEIELAISEMQLAFERAGQLPDSQADVELALGVANHQRGEAEEAVRHYDKAIPLIEQVDGPDSLRLIILLNNKAACLQDLERDEEAIATLQSVIALSDRLMGPNRDNLRVVWSNLASSYENLGRLEEARQAAQHTLVEPENAYSAVPRAIIAETLSEEGRTAEAVAEADRALALSAKLGILESPDGANIRSRCAHVFLDAGDRKRAKAESDAMKVTFEKLMQPDSPDWVSILTIAGPIDVANGERAKGIAELEQALRRSQAPPVCASCSGEIKYRLAQALTTDGGDRARAAALAGEAVEELARFPARKRLHDEAVAWRAKAFADQGHDH